jgi:hypothetical protein
MINPFRLRTTHKIRHVFAMGLAQIIMLTEMGCGDTV